MHKYATTKEMKNKMHLQEVAKKKNQESGIQVASISDIKPQKQRFLAKYDCFFGDMCVRFQSLLGWECVYVCHHLRTGKGGI